MELTPAVLIGLWSNNRGDTLEFTSDGDFYGDNVRYMFTGDLARHVDLSEDTFPGSGHWRITTLLGAPDGKRASVGVSFDVVGRQSAATSVDKLEAWRDGDHVILVYYIGDPDLNQTVTYRRCESGCQSPVPDRPSLGTPSTADPERLAGTWMDQHGMRLVLAPPRCFHSRGSALRLCRGADPAATRGEPEGAAQRRRIVVDQSTGARSGRLADDRGADPRESRGQDLILATTSTNPDVLQQYIYHRH